MAVNGNTLYLLDGMALVYRGYFAFSQNPRITSNGFDTSAIYGFLLALLEILEKEAPSHIAVAFDTDKPTARHLMFEKYKAQRQEMPQGIRDALPIIKELVQGFDIPVIEMPGYEADDIIGTLAHKAADAGYTVFMVTPDKDFGQLVRDNVYIYKPARMGNGVEILGVPEILAKWEITHVNQVIDVLGLWGDASDNIPGVPGVGEKTAKALIAKYGSMENILENTHELKGKQRENFINFKDQALLSKTLATIQLDVPVDFNENMLLLGKPNETLLSDLFTKYEFKSIAKRIFGNDNTTKNQEPATQLGQQQHLQMEFGFENTPEPAVANQVLRTYNPNLADYELINSVDALQSLLHDLLMQPAVCFDTETDSLDPLMAKLLGVSFCYRQGKAYYVNMPADETQKLAFFQLLQTFFANPNIEKIAHNLKFDYQILTQQGLTLNPPFFDTMLAHYLIDPDLRHNMDYLSEIYLQYKPISITELIGKKGKNQGTMADVPLKQLAVYAAEDADVTWQLYQIFKPKLVEQNLERLFNMVEMPLVQVLAAMETEGIKIDKTALAEYSSVLATELLQIEQNIYQFAGTKFNIASPKQLGEVLFDLLKLDPKAKKTKTGQYKTDEEVLINLASEHQLPALILEFRQMQKLKSTYIDALPLLIHPKTGRVHTSFNQAVAATGRLSSTNPNVQNIPIRTERGKEVRRAFIAGNNDMLLLAADYSQIELRIMASISADEQMIAAFNEGQDIHTATAAKVYQLPLHEVTAEHRRKAKMVNFGIIYGISAFGLAQRLGVSRTEASALIEQYFKTYPGVKKYMSQVVNKAREMGFVETLFHRRRYVRDIRSANATVRGFAERNAINAPIQGTAADMIKLAMIHIQDAFLKSNIQSKMLLQVHDELIFDIVPTELEQVKAIVVSCMQNALPLAVPIEVGLGIGKNWLEAH